MTKSSELADVLFNGQASSPYNKHRHTLAHHELQNNFSFAGLTTDVIGCTIERPETV